MTEEERAERIAALQARRTGSTRPAGSSRSEQTEPLDQSAIERQARIERLQARRSQSSEADSARTQQFDDLTADRRERIRQLQERNEAASPASSSGESPTANTPWVPLHAVHPADDSTWRGSKAAAPRPRRRSHKAEASRVAAVGAGVSLTFSLMAFMARADTVAAEQTPSVDPQASTQALSAVPVPASDPTASTFAPATSQAEVPVILAPIQTRTRIVQVYRNSGGGPTSGGGTASGGGSTSGGGAPVATAGGGGSSSVQAPAPPPPPPPPPTASNGSK